MADAAKRFDICRDCLDPMIEWLTRFADQLNRPEYEMEFLAKFDEAMRVNPEFNFDPSDNQADADRFNELATELDQLDELPRLDALQRSMSREFKLVLSLDWLTHANKTEQQENLRDIYGTILGDFEQVHIEAVSVLKSASFSEDYPYPIQKAASLNRRNNPGLHTSAYMNAELFRHKYAGLTDKLNVNISRLKVVADSIRTNNSDGQNTSADAGEFMHCDKCGKLKAREDWDRTTCPQCLSRTGKLGDLQVAIRASGDDPSRVREWRTIGRLLRKQFQPSLTKLSNEELWDEFTDWLRDDLGIDDQEYLMWTYAKAIELLREYNEDPIIRLCRTRIDPLAEDLKSFGLRFQKLYELPTILATEDELQELDRSDYEPPLSPDDREKRRQKLSHDLDRSGVPPTCAKLSGLLHEHDYEQTAADLKAHNFAAIADEFSERLSALKERLHQLEFHALSFFGDARTDSRTEVRYGVYRLLEDYEKRWREHFPDAERSPDTSELPEELRPLKTEIVDEWERVGQMAVSIAYDLNRKSKALKSRAESQAGETNVGFSEAQLAEAAKQAAKEVLAAQQATQRNGKELKRQPEKSKSREETNKTNEQAWVSALSLHHDYDNGGVMNYEPVGVRELAKKLPFKKNKCGAYFKKHFGNHQGYKWACIDGEKLRAKLRMLNRD